MIISSAGVIGTRSVTFGDSLAYCLAFDMTSGKREISGVERRHWATLLHPKRQLGIYLLSSSSFLLWCLWCGKLSGRPRTLRRTLKAIPPKPNPSMEEAFALAFNERHRDHDDVDGTVIQNQKNSNQGTTSSGDLSITKKCRIQQSRLISLITSHIVKSKSERLGVFLTLIPLLKQTLYLRYSLVS